MRVRPGRILATLLFVLSIASGSLAALLGLVPELPQIAFDNQGTTEYDSRTDLLSIQADAIALRPAPGVPPSFITDGSLLIDVEVDETGTLVGGVAGDDLSVAGSVLVDANSFSGVLLTAEVAEFGFLDSGTTNDTYDFRFLVTGGELAFLYAGQDIAVVVASEMSDFVGVFSVDFGGGAKGTLGATPPLPQDHFKCYKTRRPGTRFERRTVELEDQFTTTTPTVTGPFRFCNPADKDGEGISDPTAHMMCYKIKEPRFKRRNIVVENQFGRQTLRVNRPQQLCVPAEKDGVPSALNIDHFKCYRVSRVRRTPRFTQTNVILEDQFETKNTTVVRPRLFCNPVDKDGEGILAPEAHLTCYRIKDVPGQAEFAPREIEVSDQITDQRLLAVRGDCRRSSFLCVPSTKLSVSF